MPSTVLLEGWRRVCRSSGARRGPAPGASWIAAHRASVGRRRARRIGLGRHDRRSQCAPRRRTSALPIRAPRIGMYSAVDRRQHGRGLDALGARAVRVQPDDAAQRRRPRRQAAATSSTPSSCPTRTRARSSTARPRRTCGPSTAAASATRASRRSSVSSPTGGTLITLGAASDLAIERFRCRSGT